VWVGAGGLLRTMAAWARRGGEAAGRLDAGRADGENPAGNGGGEINGVVGE
jgi:hypothetical protein